ncbi:hypothetical protein Hanom_Chr07g00625561 [Helianthus anomalus]
MWFKQRNKKHKRFYKGQLTESITNEIIILLFHYNLIHHRFHNYQLHMSKHIRTKKPNHNQSSSSSTLFCKSQPLMDYPSQIKNLKLITIQNSQPHPSSTAKIDDLDLKLCLKLVYSQENC